MKVVLTKTFSIFKKILIFIFENWQAKLGSFVVATLFYVYLQTSKITIKTLEIPVEYPKLNNGLVYSKNNDKFIKIKVEGLRDLVNYQTQFMKFVVDPNDLTVGENQIEIKKIFGANINKLKITPVTNKLTVNVEQLATKNLPVEVLFEDDLPPGYYRVSYTVKPSLVTLGGPKSILDKFSKYTLGTVSLKDIRESFTRTLKPVELPPNVALLGGIKEFRLKVNILKSGSIETGEQILKGIPIKCEKLDENLDVDFSMDEVAIKIHSGSFVKSEFLVDGIRAIVNCNYTYDPINKKIIPNSLPTVENVRILKSSSLQNIEILSVIPDKITISYRVRTELNKPSEKLSEKLDEKFFEIPNEEEPSFK